MPQDIIPLTIDRFQHGKVDWRRRFARLTSYTNMCRMLEWFWTLHSLIWEVSVYSCNEKLTREKNTAVCENTSIIQYLLWRKYLVLHLRVLWKPFKWKPGMLSIVLEKTFIGLKFRVVIFLVKSWTAVDSSLCKCFWIQPSVLWTCVINSTCWVVMTQLPALRFFGLCHCCCFDSRCI